MSVTVEHLVSNVEVMEHLGNSDHNTVLLKSAPAAPAAPTPTNDVGAWAGDEASGAAGNYWLPTASAGHRRH